MTVLTISQDTLIQLPDGATGGAVKLSYNGTTVGPVIASGDDQGRAVIVQGRLAKLTALDGKSPLKVVGREAGGRLPARITISVYPEYPAGVTPPHALVPLMLTGLPVGSPDAPGIWDLSNIGDASGGMDVVLPSERQALAVLRERGVQAAERAEGAAVVAQAAEGAAAQAIANLGSRVDSAAQQAAAGTVARVDKVLADTEQSADRAERAADNLTSISTTAGQQAAAAATGRIDAAVAQVVSGQTLGGVVDTQAQLPGGRAAGDEFTVRSTGTVWRYDGTAWADTGQGARPVSEVSATTSGLMLKKARDGGGPTVVLRGHSLMYGQDTVSADKQAASNSSGLTRSKYPTTDTYRELLGLMQPAVQVVDQSFPGDQTKHALTRWANAPVGDLMFLWLDTNDGNNYNGDQAGPATIPDTQRRYAQIIREASNRGAQVVAVGGAPINDLVVGAVNGLSAGPISQNVRAYWAAEREVALRAGAAAVLDIAEVLQEHGYNRWTDGIHLSAAAYVEAACSMAALSGPYGVTPPRVEAGARVSPLQRAHWGGDTIRRAGAPDGAVVRLSSGQSCWLAVDVAGPCELLLEAYSSQDGGPANAEIIYGLNRIPGKTTKALKITAEPSNSTVYIRGHAYASGPRLVQVRCTGGGLDIAGWRFVPLAEGRVEVPGGDAVPRPRVSRLAAYPLPQTGDWVAAADPMLPISTVAGDGSPGTATVRADMTLPAGPGAGLLLLTAMNTGAPYLIASGYMVFREGTVLKIRPWVRDSPGTDVVAAGVFQSGQDWRGVLRLALAGDVLDVYVGGEKKLSLTGLVYRHFVPGVIASGSGAFVSGLSVESL